MKLSYKLSYPNINSTWNLANLYRLFKKDWFLIKYNLMSQSASMNNVINHFI